MVSDLIMSTFSAENIVKKEKNRKLWSPIVYEGVESLEEEDRYAGTARCSSTKELLMEYMVVDIEPVWSAKERADLDVWLGWISALLSPYSAKEEDV